MYLPFRTDLIIKLENEVVSMRRANQIYSDIFLIWPSAPSNFTLWGLGGLEGVKSTNYSFG